MVYKNQNIELTVVKLQTETLGHWTLLFDRPKNFQFEAGDWIDFEFFDRYLNGGKTYSLSSSPTDEFLAITFREGLSERKLAMLQLKPGDKVKIVQYGNDYGFQLRENESSVLIAGGVGIAPFRSMLKELFDLEGSNEVHLIYLNKDEYYIFKNELEKWNQKLKNFKIDYIETNQLNRKKREKLLLSLVSNKNQKFYIAGPPAMVQNVHDLLEANGVDGRNIKLDSFGGY